MYWYQREGTQFSPVISTRVRFARNLESTPFPHLLSEKDSTALWEKIRDAYIPHGGKAISFGNMDLLEKTAFAETRLASPALAKKGAGSGLILSPEGDVSIMVNEEDHLRIQAIFPGKATEEAFRAAKQWCEYGKALGYAYRKGIGYLTACPTNLGAACRISAMIHLPALHSTGAMGSLIQNLNNLGFTVRGIFGEGSKEAGGIYQISNQLSREKSAEEICESFQRVLSDIEERERSVAAMLYKNNKIPLEDRICRAVGTIKYARKMSYGEFVSLYALVRFGKALGMDEARNLPLTDRLLVELMPAPMILSNAENRDETSRDLARAETLRLLSK